MWGLFPLQFCAGLFELQFLYGVLQFCFSAFLECVGAGNVEGCSPYNSSRDYLGYNSILVEFSPHTKQHITSGTSAQ